MKKVKARSAIATAGPGGPILGEYYDFLSWLIVKLEVHLTKKAASAAFFVN